MKKILEAMNSPQGHVKFNKYMLVVWAILLVPSLLWWQTSIVWLVFMSWYANTVGHWSGFTSAKTELENGEMLDQLDRMERKLNDLSDMQTRRDARDVRFP